MDFELNSVSEDVFLPPTLTIFVAHSLPSAFKVAKAPSYLLSLGDCKKRRDVEHFSFNPVDNRIS